MKIWFDISNAPHINLFKDLIKELESEGHEIVVTCRPLSNTVSLLDLHNIKYTIIGKHYGKDFLKKIMGYPIRVWQLQKFIKPLGVDVAISQSSFHSPVAARLLGIPSIYMNDNEQDNQNLGLSRGWTVKNITTLTENVDFYLRGEEYSSQIDHFIKAIKAKSTTTINKKDLERAKQLGFKTLELNETGIIPCFVNEYDIIVSNSVIEHVTVNKAEIYEYRTNKSFRKAAFERQKLFANEIRLKCSKYYVQTPYRYFLLESHSWLPGVNCYFTKNITI